MNYVNLRQLNHLLIGSTSLSKRTALAVLRAMRKEGATATGECGDGFEGHRVGTGAHSPVDRGGGQFGPHEANFDGEFIRGQPKVFCTGQCHTHLGSLGPRFTSWPLGVPHFMCLDLKIIYPSILKHNLLFSTVSVQVNFG